MCEKKGTNPPFWYPSRYLPWYLTKTRDRSSSSRKNGVPSLPETVMLSAFTCQYLPLEPLMNATPFAMCMRYSSGVDLLPSMTPEGVVPMKPYSPRRIKVGRLMISQMYWASATRELEVAESEPFFLVTTYLPLAALNAILSPSHSMVNQLLALRVRDEALTEPSSAMVQNKFLFERRDH